MLTRAQSAPAHLATPGILRYDSLPLPSSTQSIRFAPLPETEEFPRRHRVKLGISGRTSFLNRQRMNPNRVNYKQGISNTDTELPAMPQKPTPVHPGYTRGGMGNSRPKSAPNSAQRPLRRSASEPGTSTQPSAKSTTDNDGKRPGGGWGFWKKKDSKHSALSSDANSEKGKTGAISPKAGEGSPDDSVAAIPVFDISTLSIAEEAADMEEEIEEDIPDGPSLTNSPEGALSALSMPPTPPLNEVALEEVKVAEGDATLDTITGSEGPVKAAPDTADGESSDVVALLDGDAPVSA